MSVTKAGALHPRQDHRQAGLAGTGAPELEEAAAPEAELPGWDPPTLPVKMAGHAIRLGVLAREVLRLARQTNRPVSHCPAGRSNSAGPPIDRFAGLSLRVATAESDRGGRPMRRSTEVGS